MVIYLFRDEHSSDIFAFSTDPSGRNIPPATASTMWAFLEAIDTLAFPAPWDIGDFQDVLEHLKVDGFYLFQGELITPAVTGKSKPTDVVRH
jgi:hypothetical protein